MEAICLFPATDHDESLIRSTAMSRATTRACSKHRLRASPIPRAGGDESIRRGKSSVVSSESKGGTHDDDLRYQQRVAAGLLSTHHHDCESVDRVNVSSVPPASEGKSSRSAPHAEASGGRENEAAHLAELMALSSRGHEEAFAELYDRTSQRIYGIILRVLRSPDHAAEVTQEVYVEVWRQSARFAPDKAA